MEAYTKTLLERMSTLHLRGNRCREVGAVALYGDKLQSSSPQTNSSTTADKLLRNPQSGVTAPHSLSCDEFEAFISLLHLNGEEILQKTQETTDHCSKPRETRNKFFEISVSSQEFPRKQPLCLRSLKLHKQNMVSLHLFVFYLQTKKEREKKTHTQHPSKREQRNPGRELKRARTFKPPPRGRLSATRLQLKKTPNVKTPNLISQIQEEEMGRKREMPKTRELAIGRSDQKIPPKCSQELFKSPLLSWNGFMTTSPLQSSLYYQSTFPSRAR